MGMKYMYLYYKFSNSKCNYKYYYPNVMQYACNAANVRLNGTH